MSRICKKILLLHSSNDLYGASKIFLQIVQILVNKGYEIHIILPGKGPLDKIIDDNVSLKHFNLGVLRKKYLSPVGLLNRLFKIIKAIRFLSEYIKINKINLVYTNTSTIMAGGIAAKKNKIPSLYHIHEIPAGNKLYELFISKIIGCNSEKIIVVSDCVKRHWQKYISINKIERIYNGIIYLKNDFIEKLEKHDDDFLITSVSRIIPYKGHNYLIDIANELIKMKIING